MVWGVHITKCRYSRFSSSLMYFTRVQIAITKEPQNNDYWIDHISSVGHPKENLSHTFWRVTSEVFKTPSTFVIFFLINDISACEKSCSPGIVIWFPLWRSLATGKMYHSRDLSYRKEFEQLLLGTFVWTSFIFKMYETKILYCPKISFAVNTLKMLQFFFTNSMSK